MRRFKFFFKNYFPGQYEYMVSDGETVAKAFHKLNKNHKMTLPKYSSYIEKGDFNGMCYRTACSNTNAQYYNRATQQHYCRSCANELNKYSNDGKPLCERVNGAGEKVVA